MADKDKFVNIADLKAKLRYWCKTRGMTKASQDSLMETIKRIPYTVKADIGATLETTGKEIEMFPDNPYSARKEIEMLRNQLEIAHAHIMRLESKYEGVGNDQG